MNSLDLTDRLRKEWVEPDLEYTFLVPEVGNMITFSLMTGRTLKDILQNAENNVQPLLELSFACIFIMHVLVAHNLCIFEL